VARDLEAALESLRRGRNDDDLPSDSIRALLQAPLGLNELIVWDL
jgi:hypothetical protein